MLAYSAVSILIKKDLTAKKIPPTDCIRVFQVLKEQKPVIRFPVGSVGAKIKTLAPLYGLTELEELEIEGHDIQSLDEISSMTGLERLSISRNKVRSLTPLRGLKKLKILYANHNSGITNIEALKELKELTKLQLFGTSISSIEPLKDLKNLEQLYIKGAGVGDFSPICELSEFEISMLHSTLRSVKLKVTAQLKIAFQP